MKYGETLRQRSIPAWSHHNIDYDDIKHFIKEGTTSGRGKTVSIPGRDDDKRLEFEDSLFAIFADQHHRIDLFVRSKAGEIRRRIDHSKRLLSQISARGSSAADRRIPLGRLERYGRLENDVLKAGEEIKSLARFTSTQRTAFRKLLKKYKKWTGSSDLEERFRQEVLDDPKSFTKLDLGPLLDEYSVTLLQIRSMWEERIRQQIPGPQKPDLQASDSSATVSRLREAARTGSRIDFDTAIASIPLGGKSTFASYFVHCENVVELQLLLLQHSQFCMSRSRSNSLNSPISPSQRSGSYDATSGEDADYFAIVADDAGRLAQEQNSLTVNDREHQPGSTPQKAKWCARWTPDNEASLTRRATDGGDQSTKLKRKHVRSFFDREVAFPSQKAAFTAESEKVLASLRQAYKREQKAALLYSFASSRSRFIDDKADHNSISLATLDTNITIQKKDHIDGEKHVFPFALLLVRQEGTSNGLLPALEQSHLVERVPGFSMEYHAIWQTRKTSVPEPFWVPLLSRDIRKLPSAPLHRKSSTTTPNSAGSATGATDSATAVETGRSDSGGPFDGLLDAPPAHSFRNKRRRRGYPEHPSQRGEQFGSGQRYWSEYDHPEDGSEPGDPYVLYIDPNEKSSLERIFDKIGALLSRQKRRNVEEERLLSSDPGSPTQDESSDDESGAGTPRRKPRSYGTLGDPRVKRTVSDAPTLRGPDTDRSPFVNASTKHDDALIPQLMPIAFAASIVILVMAYILAMTGKKKDVYEVDFGVLFAIASSLFFSVLGFASLLRSQDVSYPVWAIGVVVLIVDAVASGGLLAWMLG
ncbi:hypothetical protein KC331_g8151 [Hortaea werneckii]|nr:hypothetical protein KC331_g8151 [Hortaea werneckii]KAI7709301.1 hypothetical protein KC353_g10456 [Hortaea werneckii]